MNIPIKDRKIQTPWLRIGVQGDNLVETYRFIVDRYTPNGTNLYEGIATALFTLPDGTVGLVKLDMEEVDEQRLALVWIIGREVTKQPGTLKAAVRISGLESQLWHSEIAQFSIAKTIKEPSSQQPAYLNRNNLRTASPLQESPITIIERSVNIPTELQNIAVQADENSETVSLILPRYFDGNDLAARGNEIYLRTVSEEGGRDDILFTGNNKSVVANEIQLSWTLRPPQTSYSGKLNIQLMIQGPNFRWSSNSASVNIMRLLDAEPVIPANPSIYETWLEEMLRVKDEAIAGSKVWADKSKEWADSVYTILDGGRPGNNRELIIDGGKPGARRR